jgi:hypothetical protein
LTLSRSLELSNTSHDEIKHVEVDDAIDQAHRLGNRAQQEAENELENNECMTAESSAGGGVTGGLISYRCLDNELWSIENRLLIMNDHNLLFGLIT